MRVSLLLALSHLSTAVWAGGYQGCLERLWLFEAYEIGALNPEMDQTLGMKCNKWNAATKQGNVAWTPCRAKGGGRCNFNEFMFFLGRVPQRNGWSVYTNGRLNVERTAENCYRIFASQPNMNPRNPVPNFRPDTTMKGVWEYNDYIMEISQKFNDAWWKKKNDNNKHLWEDFDNTREKIDVARTGDHGPYVISAARNALGGTITIHTQKLGNNPATGGVWETVDWKGTANQARASGVANAEARIRNFLDDWYCGDQDDLDHKNARSHH
ncbi:hypothetical protein DL768_004156 [Monosporascus sp. mg162]|nr:hypothetical protein DL768_004156 [Monosporascus sp. mg162]